MNYRIGIIVSLVLFLIVIHSCHSQNINHPAACIKLNDEGVKYLMNSPASGEADLDKAIELFRQAINCDSTNFVFYVNLANAYDHKHNYNLEMIALNQILAKLTKNDPTLLMEKGMLYERMGNIDSAKATYELSKKEYEKRYAAHPNDIKLIEGMISLEAVTNSKDEAIKALNEQIKKHPALSTDLSQELWFYKDFNRHNYVFRLTTEVSTDK